MRVLVTGASNPYGLAIARELVAHGHQVRVFGGTADVLQSIPVKSGGAAGSGGAVTWFPGDVQIGGSIEPALSERQALVHAAALDAPASDRKAQALSVERGARYARFAAEREQVDAYVVLLPTTPPRGLESSFGVAETEANATRGTIHKAIVRADQDPAATASEVVRMLAKLPELGKQPGRDTDAVTA